MDFNLINLTAQEIPAEFRPIPPSHIFNDLESWERTGTDPAGFILVATDADKGGPALIRLRSNPKFALKPVFLSSSLGKATDALSDGIVQSAEDAESLAKPIIQRVAELDLSLFQDPRDHTFRLLGYLYTRPERKFTPHGNWSNAQMYRYPLVEYLSGEADNAGQRLENLKDRGLLRAEELVDRVRHCPQCDYAHLNFIDICPNCESIDITQKPFLHCFTCGHVNSEEKFIDREGLSCPNCRARLRHIGTDYDRALESYTCYGCGHAFSDPQIIAKCQHCDAKSRPEDLIPRSVHAFGITEQGNITARTGTLEDVFALLDTLNNINPAYFTHLLDWAMALSRRYPEDKFSVIGIRLVNVVELTDRIGRRRVTELMDAFVSRIRTIIRTTDLTTRTSRRNLWLLLPKTPPAGCRIVMQRILEIKELSLQSEGVGLDFASATCTAPDDIQEGETAKLLLARLKGTFR